MASSSAHYVYDGEGVLVQSSLDGVVSYYPHPAYQLKTDGGTQVNVRKYYAFGGMNVALRDNGVLTWLLSDHLGSTVITAHEDGSLASEIRYRAASPQSSEGDTAFGEVRYSNGATITDNRYTGQREESEIGLYFYQARWYRAASPQRPEWDEPAQGCSLPPDHFLECCPNRLPSEP